MAEGQPSGNIPATEIPATPAGGEQTPSQPSVEETVNLSKSEHDKLQKQAAQTSEAQSRADKLEAENRKLSRGGKRTVEAPSPFEANELVQIKSKITATLLTNEGYRNLLGSKPELARVLSKNPLDLLDTDEFVDAEDAINQVLDYLDDQVVASKSGAITAPPANPVPETPTAPANPNPSGQPSKTPAQVAEEEYSKLPPMERIKAKIAGRVSVK